MEYILQVTDNSFIKEYNKDIIITQDISNATKYKTIGDAMRAATYANSLIGTAKAVRYNSPDLENLLAFAKKNNMMNKPLLEVYDKFSGV